MHVHTRRPHTCAHACGNQCFLNSICDRLAKIFVLGRLSSNFDSFGEASKKCEVFGEQTDSLSLRTFMAKHVIKQLDDVEPDLLILDPNFSSSHDVYKDTVAEFILRICSNQ